MTFKRQALTFAILALVALPSAVTAQQRAIIRFNPQAPLTPVPESEREQSAFLRMLDEDDPTRRNRLIDDLFSDFPSSEYMHMFLQARWELRVENGSPEQIIAAAESGLEAFDYFWESKLGFIDDPESLSQYPRESYRRAAQYLRYHQSMVDAYTELGDLASVAEHTDLALEAADDADTWFPQLGDEAEDVVGVESEAYAAYSENAHMYLLNNLRVLYDQAGDAEGVIEVSERMLEVLPDDVELLLSTSAQLVSQIPDDAAERQA